MRHLSKYSLFGIIVSVAVPSYGNYDSSITTKFTARLGDPIQQTIRPAKINNRTSSFTGINEPYYYYLNDGSKVKFTQKDNLYVLITPNKGALSSILLQEIKTEFVNVITITKRATFTENMVFSLNKPSEKKSIFSKLEKITGAGTYISPVLVPTKGIGEVALTPGVIVRFSEGLSAEGSLAELQKSYDVKGITPLKFTDREYLISFEKKGYDTANIFRVTRELAELPYIEWAEPEILASPIKMNFTPNDSLYSNQWHLNNTGQNGALQDADIDAPEGWDINKGDGSIVAIFDDGVQTSHPDLNIWHNFGEMGGGKESNGIDDDGNGLIDDFQGWDFSGGDNDPSPSAAGDNHGTSVAGVAAATGNNSLGVTGSAINAQILPIRMTSGTCSGYGNAMRYGGKYADVINNSWTIGACQSSLNSAIADVVNGNIAGAKRGSKGTPVLFATGNSASGWRKYSVTGFTPNTYNFEWKFSNDASINHGYNTVWLDDIDWPGGGSDTFDGMLVDSIPSGFSSSGNSSWKVVSDGTHARGASGKSVKAGTITHGQTTSLTTSRAVGSGNMSFWVWISSEEDYDFFEFYVNSTRIFQYAPGQDGHTNEVGYPASNPDTIAVGASTDGAIAISGLEERMLYSQFGSEVDVLAPSNNQNQSITTTDRTGTAGYNSNGDYTSTFGGTSSATPLVSGVVADIISFDPTLTAVQVREVLRNSAEHIGPYSYTGGRNDYYGYGRVNLHHALQSMDNDSDGISDGLDPDDDNDGMPDVWEELYGLDKNDASDANQDADGDGLINLQEYQGGTNPNDPSDGSGSNLAIVPIIELLLLDE